MQDSQQSEVLGLSTKLGAWQGACCSSSPGNLSGCGQSPGLCFGSFSPTGDAQQNSKTTCPAGMCVAL